MPVVLSFTLHAWQLAVCVAILGAAVGYTMHRRNQIRKGIEAAFKLPHG